MGLVFNYDAIIRDLGGGRHNGMCLCPAHNDKNPSLKVTQKNDGKVVVHCKAGCTQEAVISALKERGLCTQSQSLPGVASKGNLPEKTAPAREAYDSLREAYGILRVAMGANGHERNRPDAQKQLLPYFNGRGIDRVPLNALYLPKNESRRLTGKGFPAMVLPIVGNEGLQGVQLTFLTADGTDNLRGNDKKSMRRFRGASGGGYIPLGAPDPDKPLIIAEGVESALSASQITGLPAMAALSATNMKVITPRPCAEIIIAADHDESGTGEAAAEELAQRLTSSGRLVRIAVYEKAGVKKYDFNDLLRDALKDGTDIAQLRDEILRVEQFEGEDDLKGVALTMEALMNMQFPPREYLLQPWLETSSLAMIHAARGAGKTRFMMSVAYAIATGQPLLCWKVQRTARVLYVDGELPGSLLQTRVKVLGEPAQMLILSRDILMRSHGKTVPDLAEPAGREFLDRVIAYFQAEVVILDSLSTLVRSGVENDAESWVPIQDWALNHRFRGRTIIFVHHEGRNQQQRGTSKREDVLDTIIRLKEREDLAGEDEAAFELMFRKSREFYGADRAPMILRLKTKSGIAEWSYELERDHTREQIEDMKKQGMTQTDIGNALGLSQSQISRILKSATKPVTSKAT